MMVGMMTEGVGRSKVSGKEDRCTAIKRSETKKMSTWFQQILCAIPATSVQHQSEIDEPSLMAKSKVSEQTKS